MRPGKNALFRDDSSVAACAAVARRGVNNDGPSTRRRLSRRVVPENADVMPERIVIVHYFSSFLSP